MFYSNGRLATATVQDSICVVHSDLFFAAPEKWAHVRLLTGRHSGGHLSRERHTVRTMSLLVSVREPPMAWSPGRLCVSGT